MIKFPVTSFRNSIFIRLLITYVLVIFPIVLLGFYLYYWSYNNASDDISRTTVTQLNYYLEDLNREIEWMELQQFDMLQDNELKKLVTTWEMMSSVEQRKSMAYLLHRLTSFKNSSSYIKDINIHVPALGKTISAVNSVVELDKESYKEMQSKVAHNHERLSFLWSSLHLLAAKYGGKKDQPPLYMVQIELDSSKLIDSLKQISLYENSGAFLYSDTTDFRLMGSNSSRPILQAFLMQTKEARDTTTLLSHAGTSYHINKASSDSLKLTVVTYLPEETVKRPLNFFYRWAWLFALASFIAIVAVSFFTYRFIHKPLLLFVQSFRRMEEGELDRLIEHEKKDEFGYLYTRYNQMLIKLKTLIDQDYKQKMMMQRSELKQLQSQINPHFLYNSFFILNSLAKMDDVERIEQFTIMLGEYFRFITRNSNDLVPLSEETKHSRVYTEIQGLRFSRRIQVQFDDLPEEIAAVKVPRLIIQPIIENAYEHSLEHKNEDGLLRIQFRQQDDNVFIVIEDNGDKLTDEQLGKLQLSLENIDEFSEMTGIINIHRRLVLTFGEQSGLKLERSEMNGLKVTICIQLHN
ncbi:sensor histidine kinase YesM [Paenibacillus montaniterrae]|uniref:Sensor histidine kinase YesM n=1 Tax=Paenibacillus montaniterrae TaxID=429341 RepID=A0A919YNR5_9BACL|nr:histidine kinase [Paenibacillus montaniterrae]GIP17263.1 sensor histidine kinase YesM [Paenibacillus montaniterrae]